MPEGDGGYLGNGGTGAVITVPNPLGINQYTNSYEFMIDLAKTMFTNYPVDKPEVAADRAITYAMRFYDRMPNAWKQYLENNNKKQTNTEDDGFVP